MTIFGVAIMAFCTLLGEALGQLLGQVLNVKANVGGVGLAMIFLICARLWLARRGALTSGIKLGVEFWATMYIPIVVAMAAQQNVVAAVRGGPVDQLELGGPGAQADGHGLRCLGQKRTLRIYRRHTKTCMSCQRRQRRATEGGSLRLAGERADARQAAARQQGGLRLDPPP